MKELLAIIAKAATQAGLQALRLIEPTDYELMVECGLINAPVHEATEMRYKLARIADTLATQMPGPAGRNWGNVAFNLNPAMGNSQHVNRSYQR